MAITRRQFLQGLSGVGVLVIGGGVYRATDQGVFSAGRGPAYQPWTDWRTTPAEGPLRLVQSAILAANPHNTQPWLFDVTDTEITVYADTSRSLRTMDAYHREMIIGIGCALENLMLTATAEGYEPQLTLEPGTLALYTEATEPHKVATVALSPGEPFPSALYEAIPDRHTDRHNYDPARPLTSSQQDDMTMLVNAQSDVRIFLYAAESDAYDQLASTTIQATETIIADHDMAEHGYAWVDTTWQEVHQGKDGPYIDTAGVSPLIRAAVKMLPPTSQQTFDAGWLSGTVATLENTAMLGFIAVRNLYDQPASIRAGRAWQRLHLWATTQRLSMQPINQMPEVVDRDRQLNRPSEVAAVMDNLTGDPSWRPTFVFRVGYPLNDLLPSARRPVSEVIL